jgi:hypothetical protein
VVAGEEPDEIRRADDEAAVFGSLHPPPLAESAVRPALRERAAAGDDTCRP